MLQWVQRLLRVNFLTSSLQTQGKHAATCSLGYWQFSNALPFGSESHDCVITNSQHCWQNTRWHFGVCKITVAPKSCSVCCSETRAPAPSASLALAPPWRETLQPNPDEPNTDPAPDQATKCLFVGDAWKCIQWSEMHLSPNLFELCGKSCYRLYNKVVRLSAPLRYLRSSQA